MKRIAIVPIILLLIFLTGCGLVKTKVHTISVTPSINYNHPVYKTIIIPMEIDKVRQQIVNAAKAEGFEKVVINGDTIHAKGLKVSYSAKTGKLQTLGAGAAGAAIGALLPAMGGIAVISMPLIAVTSIGSMALSQLDYGKTSFIRSSNGVAQLRTVKGGTQVRLNFVRIFYESKDRKEYYAERVEEINDAEIYNFAFKRLQDKL